MVYFWVGLGGVVSLVFDESGKGRVPSRLCRGTARGSLGASLRHARLSIRRVHCTWRSFISKYRQGQMDREERRQSRYSAQELHTSTHVHPTARLPMDSPRPPENVHANSCQRQRLWLFGEQSKSVPEVWSGRLVASQMMAGCSGRWGGSNPDETWSSGPKRLGIVARRFKEAQTGKVADS